MMNDQIKGELKPKLRFPTFRGGPAWKEKRLEDLISTITPPKKLPTSDYLTDGLFPIIDQSTAHFCGWTNDDAALVKESPPMVVFGDHTCVLKLATQSFAQGADGIKIFKATSGVTTQYLYHFLNFRPLAMEDYKRHFSILKLRRVFYSDIDLGEQQKISDCLTSLDDLITAHILKLDALKAHKEALMQQLFPREGETLPRLRFLEFRGAGKWEETSLGQIVDFESGGTPSKQNPGFWNGSIPWVSAKDMKQLFLEDTADHITMSAVDDGAKQVPTGTVLMLTRGMTLFKDVPICVLRRPMSFNQDVKALRANADLHAEFLPFLLLANKQRMLSMVDSAGHGTGRLNTDELKSLNVLYPLETEQLRIAQCLASLESLIPAQTKKLDALKTHKKGLMQQLFPSLGEVEA